MEIHIFEEELDNAYMDIIPRYEDKTKDELNKDEKAKFIFYMEKILEEIGVIIDYEWN